MKKNVSSVLIIIGMFLILSPFINNLIIQKIVDRSQEITNQITAEQIEKNEDKEAVYDYNDIREVEIISTIEGTMKMDEIELTDTIIGQIIIEDLDINLPISKGVTHSNLLMGAGTMKPDLVMGEGNYSLAGHYSKKGNLFGKLLEIENGTIVKITNKKTIYEYIIYDTQIVPETSLYMLAHDRADERGKPIISLMTCYYTSKNGKRFFALGELVDQYPYE